MKNGDFQTRMIHAVFFKAVLLLASTVERTHSNRYYITPNITTTPCPENPCYQSKTFFLNISSVVATNVAFIFLPGNHYLESEGLLLIQNQVNVSMMGSVDNYFAQFTIAKKVQEYGYESFSDDGSISYKEPSAKIICTNRSGFAFVNVSNLIIANLTFVNCGKFYSATGLNASASVHLKQVYNLAMEGVSIQNGTGYGLLAVDVLGRSEITYSSFIGNNQFYKSLLKSENTSNYKDEVWITYQWSRSSQPKQNGGNVLFRYNAGNSNVSSLGHSLLVSNVLVALGIDASYTSSGAGLSINMSDESVVVAIINVTSYRNQANNGANMYLRSYSNVTVTGLSSSYAASSNIGVWYDLYSPMGMESLFTLSGSVFECNIITYRGASVKIDVNNSNVQIIMDHCSFKGDNGPISSLQMNGKGGAVIINYCNFTGITSAQSNLLIIKNGLLHANGLFVQHGDITLSYCTVEVNNSTFISSTLELDSSSISLNTLSLNATVARGECIFIAVQINATSSVIFMYGEVTFNSSYILGKGGALYLIKSSAIFTAGSTVLFYNNSATYGGAIYMDTLSNLTLERPVDVYFIENEAFFSGGAIYIEPEGVRYYQCSFLISRCNVTGINLYFEDNNADLAGSVLYGGDIDRCSLKNCYRYSVTDIMKIKPSLRLSSAPISSDPDRVCQCANDTATSCHPSLQTATVYPGQAIALPLVAVGQHRGPAPALVLVYSLLTDRSIGSFITSSKCQTYNIPYRTLNETIALISSKGFVLNYNITVKVLQCPPGFAVNPALSSCVCHPLLETYPVTCNISSVTVSITQNTWVGYTTGGALAIQSQCPLGYCSQRREINVLNFDSQCDFNRSSVLCGRCDGNLSMTFGTYQCKQCSDYYLLLIIPFAIMGVLLVIGLVMLDITVSTGALNGIILYVNIVRINNPLFFQSDDGFSRLLSVLIAWMNLDLGIETCFYDGMNSIAKTWLQLVFPTYIFALVGAIVLTIIFGRYSSRISRLCQVNTFPALATLILLSYSKIIRTIITIFSYVQLDTMNGTQSGSVIVWQYDGSIEYLGAEHLPLFMFGLVATFIFVVPFPILLMAAPLLQSKSHVKYFFWVNKFKVFFDSYQAPHKDRYRFWPGFFLFIRLPLFMVFTVSNSYNIKLFSILVFTLIYLCLVGALSIYKNWIVLVLEMFFVANLGILSALRIIQGSGNDYASLIIISFAVVCAVISIVCIISNHWTRRCNCAAKVMNSCSKASSERAIPLRSRDEAVPQRTNDAAKIVRFSKLRESLLDEPN